LFTKLDALLIDLLKSLSAGEWQMQTIAKQWSVKDIAAHLLDGNLRTLSFSRDHYFGETAPVINSYSDLVHYLNELNAVWVNAARRLSPQVLIELLEITGPQFYHQLQQLAPFEKAMFAVAWAGQSESLNWFHIAREYTEKFIHQQQIRDAVGRPALFTKELFYPFIDTFMYALPYTYRNVPAAAGTVITVKVLTEIGGEWSIIKWEEGWQFTSDISTAPAAVISIHPDTAWKLFSKGISPEQALQYVEITGDQLLGSTALDMIAVMA
jgi:hypothetical protein